MNFKAVLALPKMACSAQTHKSISFIWIIWSTLYVYLCPQFKTNNKNLVKLTISWRKLKKLWHNNCDTLFCNYINSWFYSTFTPAAHCTVSQGDYIYFFAIKICIIMRSFISTYTKISWYENKRVIYVVLPLKNEYRVWIR